MAVWGVLPGIHPRMGGAVADAAVKSQCEANMCGVQESSWYDPPPDYGKPFCEEQYRLSWRELSYQV